MIFGRALALVIALVLAGSTIVAVDTAAPRPAAEATVSVGDTATTATASAAVAGDFNPGMIISDALFFDGGSMTAAAVQEFLNAKVTNCVAGYTCLKSYRQDTVSKSPVAGRCDAYVGAAQESAATIIAKVGLACGVSQKALLVLLQKEQGLVTSTAPSSGKYRSATGYGCPDTAACDSTFYGFFNQVYMAALQFKRYAASPTSWNHIAGRNNSVRFHPNTACGATTVFIFNQATAGLYNYTPYQPNAAALNNMYGTGDGCSSYGNRNFFRFYTDWFGSTTTTSLLRSSSSPKVYLIVDGVKHLVPSLDVLGVLAPLGGVSYVSQSYIDGLPSGVAAGRIFRSAGGKIYYVDSGAKLPFASCDQVVDYGGSCELTGYVQLTDAQISAFVAGPALQAVVGTPAGARYFISDGTRSEILDDESQLAASIPLGFTMLSDQGVNSLELVAPIMRDSVVVRVRSTTGFEWVNGGSRYSMTGPVGDQTGLARLVAGSLTQESLSLISGTVGVFTGLVASPLSTTPYLLTESGKFGIEAGTPFSTGAVAVPVTEELASSYTTLGNLGAGSFVKTANANTVYVLTETDARPVSSWATLVALAGTASPLIITVPSSVLEGAPVGAPTLRPSGLYRTTDAVTIFLIDGLGTKIPLSSFVQASEVGAPAWAYAPKSTLDAYTRAPATLGFGFVCNGVSYVSGSGSLHAIASDKVALYAIPFVTLDPSTCSQLIVGSPAIEFIRTTNGKIFLLEGGLKRPFGSYAAFATANAGRGWMPVSDLFANLIPTGAVIS